jgi:hypothetical protein
MNESTIKAIQGILGVEQDGIWGRKSQAALDAILHPVESTDGEHHVIASSFADPADIRAFRRCKWAGGSDQECFKVGDNGIGCWADDVSEGSGMSCALPPEDMEAKFGSVASAKHAKVKVIMKGTEIVCTLKDRMPHKANIKNGAGIDLNPDAVRACGMEPPILHQAIWQWA